MEFAVACAYGGRCAYDVSQPLHGRGNSHAWRSDPHEALAFNSMGIFSNSGFADRVRVSNPN